MMTFGGCAWCGYLHDYATAQYDHEDASTACPCCGLEDIEIYEDLPFR